MNGFEGRWNGRISGTNTGTFVLDLEPTGDELRATTVLRDFNQGRVAYDGVGRLEGRRLLIELSPGEHPAGTQVGPVQVTAELRPDGSLSGEWRSEVGTRGTLLAFKQCVEPTSDEATSTLVPEREVVPTLNWVALVGHFHLDDRDLIFEGGTIDVDGQIGLEIGNFISDRVFGGGEISCCLTFQGAVGGAAGVILYYHAQTGGFVAATLGMGGALCSVSAWGGQQWTHYALKGQSDQLKPDTGYRLRVKIRGSRASLWLNDVQVLTTELPFPLPRGQAGLWALGRHSIRFSEFRIAAVAPTIFVVMQFSAPFNELYTDVILPVCTAEGFRVVRADDTFGPGIIISDIARQISEASIVIADITPDNPNVFWEVGYAHALSKPTILVAERGRQLPFDVSPFRALFYDNTIAGKKLIEDGLRRHLAAIQQVWSAEHA